MNEKERIHSVKANKWVDEIIHPFPWIPTKKWLDDHNIDFIVHDPEPYKIGDLEDCYGEMKEAGMFLPNLRTKGLSTTDLITRILKKKVSFFPL